MKAIWLEDVNMDLHIMRTDSCIQGDIASPVSVQKCSLVSNVIFSLDCSPAVL